MMENMVVVGHIKEYVVFQLTRELADKYKEQITDIWNLIPLSNHEVDDILQEEKDGTVYHHKWDHSLLVLSEDKTEVIAFIVGFERPGLPESVYSKNNIHLKSVSVGEEFQRKGIGKALLKLWLDFNTEQGYMYLSGPLLFSVQTNSADWNERVQDYYQKAGFEFVGTKEYPNKVDNVYYLDPKAN